MKNFFYCICLLMIFSTFVFSAGISFKKEKQIVLKRNGDNFIQALWSFFITNENYIYILDFKAGNMKVFNDDGKFIKNIGKKGLGPGEYSHLFASAYKNKKFFIFDSRIKKIFGYNLKKNNKIELIIKKKFFNNIIDLKFIGDKLLMAGNFVKSHGKFTKPIYYTSCIYDIKNNKYNYLLTLAYCNNFPPGGLYKNGVAERLFALPMGGYIDSSNEYIFYVKKSKLRIIRIDRKTNKKIIFGNKTKNYIEPVANSELTKALQTRNDRKYKLLLQNMSFIIGTFVLKNKNLGILYTKYIKQKDSTDLYLQIYDMSGNFISEKLLLHAKSFYSEGIFSYFQKKTNTLHILDTETTEDFDQVFRMHKFGIKL